MWRKRGLLEVVDGVIGVSRDSGELITSIDSPSVFSVLTRFVARCSQPAARPGGPDHEGLAMRPGDAEPEGGKESMGAFDNEAGVFGGGVQEPAAAQPGGGEALLPGVRRESAGWTFRQGGPGPPSAAPNLNTASVEFRPRTSISGSP